MSSFSHQAKNGLSSLFHFLFHHAPQTRNSTMKISIAFLLTSFIGTSFAVGNDSNDIRSLTAMVDDMKSQLEQQSAKIKSLESIITEMDEDEDVPRKLTSAKAAKSAFAKAAKPTNAPTNEPTSSPTVGFCAKDFTDLECAEIKDLIRTVAHLSLDITTLHTELCDGFRSLGASSDIMSAMHCNPVSHPPAPGSTMVPIHDPSMVNDPNKLGYWSSRVEPSNACNGTVTITKRGAWSVLKWTNGYVAEQHQYSIYEAELPSIRCREACKLDDRCIGSYMDPNLENSYFICNIVHHGENIVNPKEILCGLTTPICVGNYEMWVKDEDGNEKCIKTN